MHIKLEAIAFFYKNDEDGGIGITINQDAQQFIDSVKKYITEYLINESLDNILFHMEELIKINNARNKVYEIERILEKDENEEVIQICGMIMHLSQNNIIPDDEYNGYITMNTIER